MVMLKHVFQRLHLQADTLGNVILHLFLEIRHTYLLILSIILVGLRLRWLTRPAVINVVTRQVYFTGVLILPWVVFVAVGMGMPAIYSIVDLAKTVQDMSLIGHLISTLWVQEVAPLVVSILLLSRSGVALVTELGTIHMRGEDLTLRSMGINIQEYLLWPRFMAFILCGLILTFVFVLVSILAGGLFVAFTEGINIIDFLFEVQRGTSFNEVMTLTVKSILYPTLCAIMSLREGCSVGYGSHLIAIQAKRGIFGSLMLIIVVDAVIASIQSVLS